MKSERTNRRSPAAKRGRAGFTLAEVLAALAFMAIVIPVAVDGVRIANMAGQVGVRRAVATRIAERVLNEWTIGQSRSSAQKGTVEEGVLQYNWTLRSEPWPEDSMRLLTVEVTFPVQGKECDVRLSTLMNTTQ